VYKRRKRKGKYCESELPLTVFLQLSFDVAISDAGKVKFAPKVY
jgi:hypothetical protein